MERQHWRKGSTRGAQNAAGKTFSTELTAAQAIGDSDGGLAKYVAGFWKVRRLSRNDNLLLLLLLLLSFLVDRSPSRPPVPATEDSIARRISARTAALFAAASCGAAPSAAAASSSSPALGEPAPSFVSPAGGAPPPVAPPAAASTAVLAVALVIFLITIICPTSYW